MRRLLLALPLLLLFYTNANAQVPTSLGWYQIPNTTWLSLCPSPSPGGTSCSAVTAAWSSGVADTKRNRLLFWGGGHADYGGNEVYALNLTTLTMTRLSQPSPATLGVETNADGTAATRHTYGGLTYIPAVNGRAHDFFYSFGGFTFGSGGCGPASTATWLLNLDTLAASGPSNTSAGAWARQDPVNGTPITNDCVDYQSAEDYDPNTDTVYGIAGPYYFFKWVPNTNTMTQLQFVSGIASHVNAVVDYGHKLFMIIGNGSIYSSDLTQGSPTMTNLASTISSTCSALVNANYPGLAFDPAQNAIVGWIGGNSVIILDPIKQTCTTQTFANGPSTSFFPGATNGGETQQGIFGHFRYFPSLGVFAVVGDWGQNAFALRLDPVNGSNDPATLTDFQARCAAPGVIVCQGFDNDSQFVPMTNTSPGGTGEGANGAGGYGTIVRDPNITASGSGALRYEWDPFTGANGPGYYRVMFSSLGNSPPGGVPTNVSCFGPTAGCLPTFYLQYRFRITPEMVNQNWGDTSNNTSWKFSIFHWSSVTCGSVELTATNRGTTGNPIMYTDCGGTGLWTNLWPAPLNITGTTPLLLSQGDTATTGYNCQYGTTLPNVNCFQFPVNTWMTFYYKVTPIPGGFGTPTTAVQAWVSNGPGQPMKEWINVSNLVTNQNNTPNQDFNSVELLNYMTGKNASLNHPIAYTWYDEVIVSTQPIAAPGSTPVNPLARYVDFVNGSDLFDGTAKTHTSGTVGPWKSSPYMQGNATCSDNGGTHFNYTHTAGQQIIFKGGVSWPAACFGMHITASGVAGSPDYYGVDQTWFTGASFTRPKFDSVQQFAANGNHIIDTTGASGSGCTNGAGCPGLPYLTFDNLEIANSLMHLTGTNVDNTGLMVFGGQHSSAAAVGVTVQNMYLHDWASTDNITSTADFSYGAIYGASLVTNTTISDQNGYAFIGGVKTFGWSGGGCVGCGEFKQNLTHHAWVVCSSCTTIHDNESYNIDATGLAGPGGIHTHAYYQDGGGTQATNAHDTIAVYNNYHHDSTASLVIAVCYNTAVFNNLVDNASGNVSVELDMCNDDSASVVGEVVNNTFNTGTNVFNESCWRTPSATAGLGTIRIQNNFCIPSSGSAGGVNTTHQIISNNLVLSLAQANTAGYNSANKFKAFPSPGPTSTVSFGTNLTSIVTGVLTPLALDVQGTSWAGTAAVSRPVNTGTGTCGGVSSITPCWDAGVYQSGGVNAPAAPTGLAGTVSGSTVSLSWTASSGVPTPTAYTEYRGTVHGGPYVAVQSGITALSTTDTPANGTYFYVVTAFVGGVVSTVAGNGTTATVTCAANCAFPTGTVFIIGGNSQAAFNGTFTSTGQPTASTFTFASSTNVTGTGGGVWQSGSESAKSNEISVTVPAALTASFLHTSLTFSSQTIGTSSAAQTNTFTNTSAPGGTVTISGKSITGANAGDFSFTDNCPSLLLSSVSCNFNVTFTPTAPGTRVASLNVFDNASGSPQTASLSGTGVAQTPIVTLNPTSLNFGDQTLSTTSSVRSIILTNTGSGTLNITSVVASGDFAVVTVPVTNCGGTLAPLATCSLNVTFTPTATGGRVGAVTVTDNAAGSPHVANLSGNGITTKCAMSGNVTLSGFGSICQ